MSVMDSKGVWARMRSLLSPPLFPEDEEKTRIADLLNAVLLSLLIVSLILGIPSIIVSPSLKRILVELSLILAVIGLLVLLRMGRVRLASAIFSLVLFVAVSVGSYISGGFRGTTMSAYFAVVLMAGILLGNWAALAFGVVTIAFTGWLIYADARQLLPSVSEMTTLTTLWGEFSAVLIVVIGLFALVMKNLRQARDRTKLNEKELAVKLVESEQLTVWVQEFSEYKTHLLSRISHELRTPLGVIVGMSELLKLETYGLMTSEQKKLLDRIQINSKYLETTFSDLLEQSQLDREMLPAQSIGYSPAEILKKIAPEFRLDAKEKGIQFEVQISPELPERLLGIPSRVEQILYHLISNAIKFTETGSVSIALFRSNESHWAMRVTDTGIGVPNEHLESIFEPFWQIDETIAREYGGMGLGLAIVKRLTSSMKGKIKVESEPGMGSTFTVTFPLETSKDENHGSME